MVLNAIILFGFLLVCDVVSVTRLRRFPDYFKFGTGTSSYQTEGGWDADGKGENIWDRLTHSRADLIRDRSNGDIAADSYNNYKRDVEMMRELGVDVHRFSLSWARILPTGFSNNINAAGVDYYNKYINEMLKYDIIPIITLYHSDLPQKLQDLGGFVNPLIVNWFGDYARLAFELFGDRVKFWITFNDPRDICHQGYGAAAKAPTLDATGVGDYVCTKNLLLAHAKAYHAYDTHYRPSQGGLIGVAFGVNWYSSLTDSVEDIFATVLRRQAEWDLYIDPIYSKNGGFPRLISQRIAQKSAEQRFPSSRLPEFTEQEKQFIRGTSDFMGINQYTTFFVSSNNASFNPIPSMEDDVGTKEIVPEEWEKSASSWLKLAPKSLYNVLNYMSKKYNNPPIFVTENGWSNTGSELRDDKRIKYYRAALNDVLDALENGIDVRCYIAWSLMDSFEWMSGYTERFGLYEVDFTSPARTRTPRKSAFVYKQIIKSRVVDHSYEPDLTNMTITDSRY